MYPIILLTLVFIYNLSCFNVCILGNVLLSLWIAMCSPIHYEHNSYIQSKHRCLISYWGCKVQWFETIELLPDNKLEWEWLWLLDNYWRFWLWTIWLEGTNVLDDLECEWERVLKLWTLTYFLLRKFYISELLFRNYLNDL